MTAEAVALRQKTVEAAGERLEELADFMLARIIERMGSTRDLSSGDIQDLRYDVVRGVVYFLASLSEERAPTRAELHELHEIGAQRARLGILRHEMLASVDIAAESGISFLFRTMSDIAHTDRNAADPAVLLACASELSLRLYTFTNVMKDALALGYFRQAEQPSGGTSADMTLVNTLVGQLWEDESALRDEARRRGRPLGRWNGCLLAVSITGALDHRHLVGAASVCAERIPRLIQGPSRMAVTRHVIFMAPCMKHADWEVLLDEVDQATTDLELLVVAAGPVNNLTELKPAYERALRDLPVARAARRTGGTVQLQELRLLKLLATAAPDLSREYEEEILGKILARDDAEETLDILEDRSHKPAQLVAERHSMPKRTVERAVQRAARLTGLDFNLPAQRLEFEVALRLYRLRQAASSSISDELT
jgi:hypothetical protein